MSLRYPSHLQLPGHVGTPERGTNYFTGPLEASKNKVDFFFFLMKENSAQQIDSLGLWAVPESCRLKVAEGPKSRAIIVPTGNAT